MSSARVTGIAILALGFAASGAAVMPGFDQLLHDSKTYLAVTSLIGLAVADTLPDMAPKRTLATGSDNVTL